MRNIIPAIIAFIVFKLIMMLQEAMHLENGFWILTAFWGMLILTVITFIIAKKIQNNII